jgi:hypothetical protein
MTEPEKKSLELQTIGDLLLEQQFSLASKVRADIATSEDKANFRFAEEVIALARNRLSVFLRENEKDAGKAVWVERSLEQYPHIRLHGGALEDDPPK